MKTIVFFIPFLFAFWILSAQTVSNVTVVQVDKTICVSYDLDKTANISLFLTTDGGVTYTELRQVSGDVGKNVSAGHKTIVWNVLSERERLVGDNIVFKVRAQGLDNLTFTVNGVTFKMIYVKGGTFIMGCTSEQGIDCDDKAKPSHSVTLSDYWMGETEVTEALWLAVMGSVLTYNGEWESKYRKGRDYPVCQVSWEECREFCNKLNSKLKNLLPSGYRFSLPTEAEWEYAARGGNKSRYYKYSGSNSIGEVAWWYYESLKYKGSKGTHPVKGKLPNELGLYDMSGNAWEWCSDWFGSYNSSSQTNPIGPSSGSYRVLRGGSWNSYGTGCRVADRFGNSPSERKSNYGFRLALVQ